MIIRIKNKIRKYYLKPKPNNIQKNKIKIEERFFKNGQIPWSEGYEAHKEKSINQAIVDDAVLSAFLNKNLPNNFGYRLDERIVEYTWIFSKLKKTQTVFLDAGSTFNFKYLLNHKVIEKKEKYIYTFYPESNCFHDKKISYVFGDLRNLPFKDDFFEEIVCQSTIEHIDMDNSIYGYEISHIKDVEKKSYEYIYSIHELVRVLKSKGNLLLTFPYGKFENHGFFQQFDESMLNKVLNCFEGRGRFTIDFFKYEPNGWRFANKEELSEIVSFNPHTGKGKGDDLAAHCRSVACINFCKD